MDHSNFSKTLPALYGLILAGGQSKRMGQDKAALHYKGEAQLMRAYRLLSAICEKTYVSVSAHNKNDVLRLQYPQIIDDHSFSGPTAGILSAMQQYPDVAWLVIACDLFFLDSAHLIYLRDNRDISKYASAFHAEHTHFPEPLCAIWEPSSYELIKSCVAKNIFCPRQILMQVKIHLLAPFEFSALHNINTQQDLMEIR